VIVIVKSRRSKTKSEIAQSEIRNSLRAHSFEYLIDSEQISSLTGISFTTLTSYDASHASLFPSID
jgi:hypothetical protein